MSYYIMSYYIYKLYNLIIGKEHNTIDELQLKINATKSDIEMDYDSSQPNQLIIANEELFKSFNNFSYKNKEYVRTQLFQF